MITNCPVCGKLTAIHWPQHWIYRRGDTYYCSWNCLDVDIMKDLKLMHEVQRKRRERKMYNKLKKDGTPAKKSGPKPKKVEVPEPVSGGEWEKVETPEKKPDLVIPADVVKGPIKPDELYETIVDAVKLPKITMPVTYDGMVIREVEGLFGRYRYTDIGSAVYIDFENADNMDTLSLTVEQWRKFREEQTKAAAILGVEL